MDLDFNSFDDIPLPIKAAFVAIICALVFYFAYMIDYSNTLRITRANQSKEADLKTSLQSLYDTNTALRNKISDFQELTKTLVQWQSQLIKPSELSDLLNEILKIGSGNNLQFDLFNPGDKIKEDMYLKVPIKIVVEGSYNQIADFISQIANMKWLIAVNDFIIAKKKILVNGKESSETTNTSGGLISEITVEVYYRDSK
jgi:type IV pilus assembly protein PilO